MSKIRLCHLITELRPAGAEKIVYELATRVDRDRFETHVAALRGGAVAEKLREANVPVTVLDVRSKGDVFKLARLTDLLRRGRFDILHTHLFHADLAGRIARAGAGTPKHLCHTIHVAEQRFRPWRFLWARLGAGGCEQFIAVSRAVRDHHARRAHLPTARYLVIPNGTDLTAGGRDPSARARLRNQWGIGEVQVVLAFLGRLDRQKGLDVLLEAIRRLHANGDAPQFVLAGDGPQRAMLETFLADDPAGRCVRRLGFVQDVRSVLNAADALVLPSRWEGFGLAVIEAMAAELPVIATAVQGPDEIVLPGQTGLLVPKEDPQALAAAIDQLSRDETLRRRMGRAGLQRVRERYGIERTLAAHEQLYLRMAGR